MFVDNVFSFLLIYILNNASMVLMRKMVTIVYYFGIREDNMGLFDDLTKSVGAVIGQKLGDKIGASQGEKLYGEKYKKYVGVDFTFDYEEYPNGTELINEFTEDLEFHVKHNDVAGSSFLAENFVTSTLGEEVCQNLVRILGHGYIGSWISGLRPWNLARKLNGEGHVFRELLLSDGFKNLCSDKMTTPEINALIYAINDFCTNDDIPYIKWSGAAIYNPKNYADIRKTNKLAGFVANGGTFKDQAVEFYRKTIKDDLKEFHKRHQSSNDDLQSLDLSKYDFLQKKD